MFSDAQIYKDTVEIVKAAVSSGAVPQNSIEDYIAKVFKALDKINKEHELD